MRHLLIFLALAGAGAGAVAEAAENSQVGALAGTVAGPDGAPLAGIRVRVTSLRSDMAWMGETDADGRFLFPALATGIDYIVRVEDPDGCLRPAVQDRITVAEGATRREAFRLDHTIAAWPGPDEPSRPPLVNMREIGNRVVFDHVFIQGLPLIR